MCSKEEAQRDEVEDWELVLIVVATAVESAFFFQCFFGTFLGRRFQRSRRDKKTKQTKTNFPNNPSLLFVFPFLFLSLFSFIIFCLSLSLSLFLSFYFFIFLSLLLGEKITKITKIMENHQKHQNHQKSTKSSKIPKNPIKIGVPKITFAKITKHYENRVEQILGTQHAR